MALVRDRLQRIEALKTMRQEHPDWSEEKIIKHMSVLTGVRFRRVEEYIQLLKDTDNW